MEDLLKHILEPIATEPEKIRVECEHGEFVLHVNLYLGHDDYETIKVKYADAEYAIRHILSIASGEKKPYLTIYDLDAPQEEEKEEEQEEKEEEQEEESSSESETSSSSSDDDSEEQE